MTTRTFMPAATEDNRNGTNRVREGRVEVEPAMDEDLDSNHIRLRVSSDRGSEPWGYCSEYALLTMEEAATVAKALLDIVAANILAKARR